MDNALIGILAVLGGSVIWPFNARPQQLRSPTKRAPTRTDELRNNEA